MIYEGKFTIFLTTKCIIIVNFKILVNFYTSVFIFFLLKQPKLNKHIYLNGHAYKT